jgi:hypothetical protein
MLTTRRWITLLLPPVAALSQSACTLIGYGVGAVTDARNKQTFEAAAFGPAYLELGTKITVVLLDSSEVKGKYAGLELEAPEEYAERYAAARADLAPRFALPGLGEPITVIYDTGARLEAELAGFDFRRLIVVMDERHTVWLAVLEELAFADGAIAGDELALLVDQGALPVMTGIALDDATLAGGRREERARIPLDGVRHIVHMPSSGRTKGLITGAVVDVAVIVAAVACASSDCLTSPGWNLGH